MFSFAFAVVLVAFIASVASQQEPVRPYMGWSSWSLQATTMPGRGGNWLKEDNILQQIDVMAASLKDYGYVYVNLDSGWSADFNWNSAYDEFGRPTPNAERFPRGIKYLADYAHERGLKLGIYAPVGLPMGVFGDDQNNKINFPVAGTDGACTGFDLVYPDWRVTNGWDSSYKMDFESGPCSRAFIQSMADLFVSWDIDFFKLDGVGPGSWKNGTNYDNRGDVIAWSEALKATGRDVILEISWELDIWFADTWTEYAHGWRIDTDVECYCETLVRWTASVVQRWTDLVPWIDYAGPGRWNDLDTINVGNGTMDGITRDERQSYMTLWVVACAPLYIGDDLTMLDEYGLQLLTNREAIAINQEGVPARPITPYVQQQVWWSVYPTDGSYIVALFNLAETDAVVRVDWVQLGFSGTAWVRDVWASVDMGSYQTGFYDRIPSHGSRLLRVTRR